MFIIFSFQMLCRLQWGSRWNRWVLISTTSSYMYTTELKIHWYSQKLTDIIWHLLFIGCTSFNIKLIFTVPHCALLYMSTDQHCIVQFYRLPLYRTEHGIDQLYRALTSSVHHCTINLKNKVFLKIVCIFSSIFIFIMMCLYLCAA